MDILFLPEESFLFLPEEQQSIMKNIPGNKKNSIFNMDIVVIGNFFCVCVLFYHTVAYFIAVILMHA